MTLREILQAARRSIAGEPLRDPQSILEAIDKLEQWCYKDLCTDDLERVCRCANCVHYKRYRKKASHAAGVKCCVSSINPHDTQIITVQAQGGNHDERNPKKAQQAVLISGKRTRIPFRLLFLCEPDSTHGADLY